MAQPDSILSSVEQFIDDFSLDLTMLDYQISSSPIHEKVIRRNLTRSLDLTTDLVLDELSRCFDEYWGNDPEWRKFNVWDSMTKFFARTSNRIFVGEPLCMSPLLNPQAQFDSSGISVATSTDCSLGILNSYSNKDRSNTLKVIYFACSC